MSEFTVVWAKRWEQPICAPGQCPHPCTEKLSINQRLEPTKRGQRKIAMDGCICMNCGADTTGNLSLKVGLIRLYEQFRWQRETSERVYDLVEFHENALIAEGGPVPIWFYYAWGWSGRKIVDALNSGELEAA